MYIVSHSSKYIDYIGEYIDLARAKSEAPIYAFIICFRQ